MKQRVPVLIALLFTARTGLPAGPDLRVELLSGKRVMSLTIQAARHDVKVCGVTAEGPCVVLRSAQTAVCSSGPTIHCQSEGANRNFVFLSVSSLGAFRVTAIPAGAVGSPPVFQARRIRVTSTGAALRMVTEIDLESYVSGVLSGEASTCQAGAARAAMAILARTWALRWRERHQAQGFDFCSLTHCQAFRLPQGDRTNSGQDIDPAARATRDRVLTFRGALADPYFTACCGGMTEAAGNVWPDRAQPYLAGVRDPYCLSSAHAAWQRELGSESVQRILGEILKARMAAPLTELSVEKRDSSGRAQVLRFVAGSTWSVDANQFRYAFDRQWGWGQIKSNLYSIQLRGGAWAFSGHGLGHGVGLCQAGAEQMGRMGISAERILSTYFPGTEISSPPPGDADPIARSDHFELAYPSTQEPWVTQTLEWLERWRRNLGEHSETLPPRIRVQTWNRTDEFIRATGQPGWTAAVSDGESIDLQPLAVLGRKGILNQTLRHEITHVVVHKLAAKGVPRWYEEGLVLYLSEERIGLTTRAGRTAEQLEEAVSKPRSEAEMKAAYAEALERVRRFAQRQGDAALWRVLAHPSTEDLRWLRASAGLEDMR